MTPEGKVKKVTKEFLKKHGVHWFMPVQAGHGQMGVDFHCVYRGQAFFIETKAPRGKMTPRQRGFQIVVEHHGAKFFVVRCKEDLDPIELWMAEVLITEDLIRELSD